MVYLELDQTLWLFEAERGLAILLLSVVSGLLNVYTSSSGFG